MTVGKCSHLSEQTYFDHLKGYGQRVVFGNPAQVLAYIENVYLSIYYFTLQKSVSECVEERRHHGKKEPETRHDCSTRRL